ncbi:P-loop NTPase [Candidatus Woesearchaeota archaeon]|nr:P-loop NTPase [Candidatus Woesearchaeota archaeon]
MTKFFAIISAKGGVGKTTTTINLAGALLAFGREVIAIDADLTAPNMSIMLGVPNLPRSLHDVLDGKLPLSSCLYYHHSGLRIIPGNIAYESAKDINLSNFKYAIQELQGKAEIVLIDGAPGVSPEAQTIIEAVDFVIPITTPDLAAMSDCRKTIKMARELNKAVFGIIVNRVRGEAHEVDVPNIEAFLETPVIGVIPEETAVRQASQLKSPVIFTHPDEKISHAYKQVAAKLFGEEYHAHAPKKEVPSFAHEVISGWMGKK